MRDGRTCCIMSRMPLVSHKAHPLLMKRTKPLVCFCLL